MIENVSTQLTVFHCFAHCLLPGRAFASLYVLLFLEKEAEIGGRVKLNSGELKWVHCWSLIKGSFLHLFSTILSKQHFICLKPLLMRQNEPRRFFETLRIHVSAWNTESNHYWGRYPILAHLSQCVRCIINSYFKGHLLNYWMGWEFTKLGINGLYMALFILYFQIVSIHCISKSHRLK